MKQLLIPPLKLAKHDQLKHNIEKLYLYNFLSFFHVFSAVLIPFFTGWGGLSLTETLLLQSWFTFWAFALEIPTGVVADIFSRRLSLILGALISVLGYLWYPLLPHIGVFLVGEFLLALGLALRSGATEALACDSVPESEYGQVLPKLGSISMLGILLGPAVGAVLVGWVGSKGVMWLQAVPALFAMMVALFLEEPPKRESESAETTRFWDTFLAGWQFFRSHKEIQLLALDMAVVAGVAKMMIWLYQARLGDGVAVEWFGWIMSSAVLLELLMMNTYGWLARRWVSRREVIMVSGLLPALGFLLAGLSSQYWLVLVGIYLAIGVGMSRKPFFAVIFNEKIRSGQRATILSTIAMSSQLFLAILNPLVGRLADWSVEGTFVLLGLGLLGFVVYSWQRLRA